MQKILIASLLLFFSTAWAQEIAPLVQNGVVVPTTSSLYRSIAQLDMGTGRCSASFLNSTTLLTAGHCTGHRSAAGMKVRVRDAQGVWHEQTASLVVTHPGYKLWKEGAATRVVFDFGVVKLAAPFLFAVRPLKMVDPSGAKGVFRIKVSGYGRYASGRNSSVLRQGVMLAQVARLPQFGGGEGMEMVPDGAPGQATCPGDSGGPVLENATLPSRLLGVNSMSNGCNGLVDSHSYALIPASVYTWIARYL